jgi:hypothetical protein
MCTTHWRLRSVASTGRCHHVPGRICPTHWHWRLFNGLQTQMKWVARLRTRHCAQCIRCLVDTDEHLKAAELYMQQHCCVAHPWLPAGALAVKIESMLISCLCQLLSYNGPTASVFGMQCCIISSPCCSIALLHDLAVVLSCCWARGVFISYYFNILKAI